jgi:hypothetical protein
MTSCCIECGVNIAFWPMNTYRIILPINKGEKELYICMRCLEEKILPEKCRSSRHTTNNHPNVDIDWDGVSRCDHCRLHKCQSSLHKSSKHSEVEFDGKKWRCKDCSNKVSGVEEQNRELRKQINQLKRK